MFALVEHDDDVAGLEAGRLVALAGECDLLAVVHALVDVHLEYLALLDDLAARARATHVLGVDALALAVALAATRVYLLIHAGAQLVEYDLCAAALACVALLHGARLAAASLALLAHHVLLQRQLARRPVVQVLERDAQLMYHVLALVVATPAATAATAAAEEHLEQVHGRAEAALGQAALLERLLAALVVELALLGVAEHLVRLRYVLELLGRVRLRILVRMVLERQLSVRLLQLVGRRVRLHIQQVVIGRLFNHSFFLSLVYFYFASF